MQYILHQKESETPISREFSRSDVEQLLTPWNFDQRGIVSRVILALRAGGLAWLPVGILCAMYVSFNLCLLPIIERL